MKREYGPAILLAVACALSLCIGGAVPTETQMLLPGQSALATSVMGGVEVPLTTYWIIGLFVAGAAIWAALRKSVLQVPPYIQSLSLAFFVLATVVSVAASSFRTVSLEALGPWLVCVGAYFVGVATIGRRLGPTAVLTGVLIGGVIIACRGLLEYSDMKRIDPSWRIFAGWMNPNATAAALGFAWFAGLGLLWQTQRAVSLIVGCGLGMISLALLLTQSKGAFAAFAVALLIAAVVIAIGGKQSRGIWFARLGAVVAIGAVLGFALIQSQSSSASSGQQGGPSPLARVQGAGDTQEQSSGFRQLLWKGAVDLVKRNPIGYGVGTYRFESSRPGLTTPTVYAHNSYLQIAVEAGVIALVGLLAFAVSWLAFVLRGMRSLDPKMVATKAASIGAVAYIAAHSMVDSDLHYFGIALPFFVVMAIGTLASPDGVSPELLPPWIRRFAVAIASLTVLLMGFGAYTEALRAKVRGATAAGAVTEARALAAQARSTMPTDGETYYLSYRLAESPAEATQLLETATRFAPSPRNWRALAAIKSSQEDHVGALAALNGALMRDPNNLPALLRKVEAEIAAGQNISAIQTAKRLIAVEQKPYFQTRSLPEIIPLETYRARLRWESISVDRDEKIELLRDALKGFVEFSQTTGPLVERMLKAEPNSNYAGIGKTELEEAYREGLASAEELLAMDPAPEVAEEARAAAAALRESLSR